MIALPVWKGFRGSSGEIEVSYHGARSTPRQRAAIAATQKRAAKMKPVVLAAILAAFPKRLTKATLAKKIELWEVIATRDHFEGVAYVAYMFECTWDRSGFVVLTHGDRVISVGTFDVLEYPHKDPLRVPPVPRKPKLTAAQRSAAIARQRKNPKRLAPEITLATWAGFEKSRGDLRVSYGTDEASPPPIGPAQQAAYAYSIKHAKAMQLILLDAIVAAYPKMIDGLDNVPKTTDRAALRDTISLDTLYIHVVERDGLAYVGYGFHASWEREHGVGVLTHGDRVIETGHADTAFLGWIAERDSR